MNEKDRNVGVNDRSKIYFLAASNGNGRYLCIKDIFYDSNRTYLFNKENEINERKKSLQQYLVVHIIKIKEKKEVFIVFVYSLTW